MAAQTDQQSLKTKPNEPQEQPSQRKEIMGSSPRATISQQRGSWLTPHEFFHTGPFSLTRRITEEMDRIFQEFGLASGNRSGSVWSPAIEVSEREGKYSVRAELPGLTPNDVKVEVGKDALVIQGERKQEHEEKDAGVRRTERQYGFFYRSIPLPDGANVEQAQAKFHNGVLEVTIPVPEQQAGRRTIPIEGEAPPSKAPQSQAA